jgi:hypothetical protein
MSSRKLREHAIRTYEDGESPKEICQSLEKSKTWFFKRLKRSQLDGQVWATIDTAKETLSIYHDHMLIDQFDYPLPKTSLDLSKNKL